MNGELYKCLKLPSPTRSAPNLVTLTGTMVPTAGVADVCLDNGIVLYNVVLTSGMGVPLLIGTDVLEANNGILDYARNVLLLGGREYDFIQQLTRSPGVAEVLLESDLDRLTGQYSDVFFNEQRGLQEATGLLPMRIETVGDPVYQRPYRAALTKSRRAQVPLEAFLSARRDEFGNRLDDLAVAYQEARENTENARRYNRARLLERANVDASLRVGDTVVVKAEEALTNTSKWDPQYQVIRVEGTTHWLRHQVTGQERRVHREKVRLVDPEIVWDEVPRRPRRQRPSRPEPVRQSARLRDKVQEH